MIWRHAWFAAALVGVVAVIALRANSRRSVNRALAYSSLMIVFWLVAVALATNPSGSHQFFFSLWRTSRDSLFDVQSMACQWLLGEQWADLCFIAFMRDELQRTNFLSKKLVDDAFESLAWGSVWHQAPDPME